MKICLILMMSLSLMAGDGWSVTVEVQGWNTNSGLQWDAGGNSGGDSTLHTTDFPDDEILPTLAVNLTFGRVFAALSKSFETEYDGDHALFAQRTFTTATSTQTDRHFVTYDAVLDREDLDLTVGWVVGSGFIVIGGYKTIEFNEHTAERSYRLDVTLQGSEGDPVNVTFNDLHDPNRQFDETYDYKGPFLGVAYAKGFDRFTFSGNIAYADLDGDYEFKATQITVDPITQQQTGQQSLLDSGSSSADGISFTVTGAYAVTDWFGVSLAYKSQKYDASQDGNLLIPDLDADGFLFGFRFTL
ncbi:MAG: hypothetical protein KDC35_12940 [Acidobacteria bacterium]|nr:hypothetical protein [Acidobacteriota bacterium]